MWFPTERDSKRCLNETLLDGELVIDNDKGTNKVRLNQVFD